MNVIVGTIGERHSAARLNAYSKMAVVLLMKVVENAQHEEEFNRAFNALTRAQHLSQLLGESEDDREEVEEGCWTIAEAAVGVALRIREEL